MAMSLLIVEDEEHIAELIAERLRARGFSTRWAASLGAARRAIADKKPDLMTLDVNLPNENGLTLLKELKDDPATASIPVVVISFSDELERAQAMGALAAISKPIDFDHLARVLEAVKPPKGGHRA